jgi:hypothetical protein
VRAPLPSITKGLIQFECGADTTVQRRDLPLPIRPLRESREVSPGWAAHPNLQQRPHAPAAGQGRLQVQIRRAFLVRPLLSTSEVYDWAYGAASSLPAANVGGCALERASHPARDC